MRLHITEKIYYIYVYECELDIYIYKHMQRKNI